MTRLAEAGIDRAGAGADMYQLVSDLFPICRSITGDGVRQTLERIGRHIPLTVHEVPTGTRVFDWTVPKEWNIRDAYIKDAEGRRVVDFRSSNLHVVSYSVPIHRRVPTAELKEHLFTIPEHPEWIPYRTSYYDEVWGFCLSNRQLDALTAPEYEVCIDASLEEGSLTYGEYRLSGALEDEVLISCHVCHPSLANDNLSGIAVATWLARHLRDVPLRYSYRFLFIPGTIGSITWLALNEAVTEHIKHGLVVSCVGDRGDMTYKKTRRGNATVDRAAVQVLRHSGDNFNVVDFVPYGYDERQYSSPGFDLAVGCLMRTPNGRYPEYHTSADNLEFVEPKQLADSLSKYLQVIDVLENERSYRNLNPKCEPQLGRRGLYRAIGGQDAEQEQLALLWVLNLSDGAHSLLDICERSDLSFAAVKRAAEALVAHDLLEEL